MHSKTRSPKKTNSLFFQRTSINHLRIVGKYLIMSVREALIKSIWIACSVTSIVVLKLLCIPSSEWIPACACQSMITKLNLHNYIAPNHLSTYAFIYLHNVYACVPIYIPPSDAYACYQEFTVRALWLPLHISEPETKWWLFSLLPCSMIPLPSFHFPFIFPLEILPFLPRLKKLLSSIPAAPPPPSHFTPWQKQRALLLCYARCLDVAGICHCLPGHRVSSRVAALRHC